MRGGSDSSLHSHLENPCCWFPLFSFHVITQPAHIVFEGSMLFLSVQLRRTNASNANASSIGNTLFLYSTSAGYLNCKGFFCVLLSWTEGKAAQPGDSAC